MGTEIYLLDDTAHEALHVGRAYWLADGLDQLEEDLHLRGDWEFIDHTAISSATALEFVRAAETGDRDTKDHPSRELVARIVAWLAVRDAVRLATEWTFDRRDPRWKIDPY